MGHFKDTKWEKPKPVALLDAEKWLTKNPEQKSR